MSLNKPLHDELNCWRLNIYMNDIGKNDCIPTRKSDDRWLDLQQNILRRLIGIVDKSGSVGFKYNLILESFRISNHLRTVKFMWYWLMPILTFGSHEKNTATNERHFFFNKSSILYYRISKNIMGSKPENWRWQMLSTTKSTPSF